MKKLLLVATTLLFVAGTFCPALAVPLNTGTYMYTVSGNDPSNPSADLTAFEAEINQWFIDNSIVFGPVDLEFYAKTDEPSETVTEDNNNGSTLNLLYANDKKAGTFQAGAPVDFYSVKAGNQYALYWLDPAVANAIWSTEDLLVGNGNQPVVSHISTWRQVNSTTPPPTNPIPEPSTMLLLGTGIAGLAAVGRRKRK